MYLSRTIAAALIAALAAPPALGQSAMPAPAPASTPANTRLKAEAIAGVEQQAKLVQEMVDSVYSFAEPGFQEFQTMEYLTGILEKHGFTITRGVAGMPTAWTATWGSGGPLIALGSDVDGLLGLSQVPGSPELKPQVAGAPGHGEGHNSGMPLQIAAAIAAKQVMQKNKIPGRLLLWPGVAEELIGAKAYYVRAGLFKDVDACIFTHVSNEFSTAWGDTGNNAAVSVEYTFHGKTAHAAGMPWEGRSALDGVELMNVGWNMRREHLPLSQRSHYVITDGGKQPNIVPDTATVWYYFRDTAFASVRHLFETGNEIAKAAAMGTGTTVTQRTLGYAAPNYGNKPLAEAAWANIKAVGMPQWSASDQSFAKSVQQANARELKPLASEIAPLSTPDTREKSTGGGSDDIGDVMWTVPTITVRYPSNIPNMIGHNVLSAIAMATPIAHKGAVQGAKAVSATVIDLMTNPALIAEAKAFQRDVQFKDQKYDPLLTAEDKPAIHLNAEIMERVRPQQKPLYYDPAKYRSYLEQLKIAYPAS
ncbi:p-aminobenzoyl-glutamate hydrolase subunit B [Sphingomonas dokdonensis]|uniref:p-aminobenzoyl-glutamate hydrolase subunit B n=2 Tax=Sphingomonas dokdonensis TaxID=344880 RepID=A0A245ZE76_9SPHN|nr:p-aminobenzoyl-glutamate hydrolase subunit B [Sphingomonas dokdonensis]